MIRRLLNLCRPSRVDADLRRELDFHLAEREDDLVAAGRTRAQAQAEARRRFGNRMAVHERTRAMDLVPLLDALMADVRYALRSMAARKGFAVVAIASLALGIGANTAIFSLINAVMLRALPVERPAELVALQFAEQQFAGAFTNPQWEQVRDAPGSLGGVFAFGGAQFNLAESGEARRVDGAWVSGSYFDVLGVTPALGRMLSREDDVRGCPATVVVSHAFWQSELGGDPSVVGRTLSLDGHPVPVIGVADRRFTGLEAGRPTRVFVPLCAAPVLMGPDNFLDNRSWWSFRVLGRLRAGVPLDAVNARLRSASAGFMANTVPPNWRPEDQQRYLARRLEARPGLEHLSSLRNSYARALWVLMAIVGLVLAIACANVANLMLARSAARQREFAVRVALGAGRWRVVRQLLTEGVLLSSTGAALGLGFAWWGGRLLVRLLSTTDEPVHLDLAPDGAVLGFTAVVAVGTALLFSLAPAWRASRADPQGAMKANGRGVVGGEPRIGFGKALVMIQVAMSLVLVVGAGLLGGSFRSLERVDAGFTSEGVLVVGADLKLPPGQAGRGLPLQAQLLERLRMLPGVVRASSAFNTPISHMQWNNDLAVDGVPTRSEDATTWINQVWDGYFETLGMTLVAGRDFGPRDVPGTARVAVINESAARRFFPGRSALGQVFRLPEGRTLTPPIEVVGVVRDAKYQDLREAPAPTAFLSMQQDTAWGSSVKFVLRVTGPVHMIEPAVVRTFAELAPRASLEFTPLARQVGESIGRDRILATLSTFFGGLALLLAMIGLYGTMAYAVARRRSEIGIRLALGAASSRVLWSVLREVGLLVGVGVLGGLAAALASSHWLGDFLFGLTPRDPATLAGSALLLAGVAVVAGYVPARRASRLDPMQTLRED